MNKQKLTMYLGTTQESYRNLSCMRGTKILFDKKREPRLNHPGFYHEDEFDAAATEAFCRADKIEFIETPIVLEGYVREDMVNSINHRLLPIEMVWRIKHEVDWRRLLTTPIPQRGDLNQYFDVLDARVLLEEGKK